MRIKVLYDKEENWLKIPVTLQTPRKEFLHLLFLIQEVQTRY